MKQSYLIARLEEIIDELAEVEHKRWAHWQRHLHNKCEQHADGSLVIPSHLVEKWERQIITPYENLSEKEKDSDREQVRKYLPKIVAALSEEQHKE